MGKFLSDRWNDILALTSSQWLIIAILSVTVGTALFYLFNWLYSQRFKAQSDVIGLQKLQLELYAGQHQSIALPAPKDKAATFILPNEWTPYLDQAHHVAGNGRRLHVAAPGDGAWARRFRNVLEQIIVDLSGPDGLSEGQRWEGEAAAGN